MGYCSVELVKSLVAQALTSATPDTLDTIGDLLKIGKELDSNLVTTDIVNTYIRDADADFDSSVNQLYVTPLKRIIHGETKLAYDINEYGTEIVVASVGTFTPGDLLLITDCDGREEIEIESITDYTITPTTYVVGTYDATTARVVRVKYPDPVPFITGRIAAANIYDKYFSAETAKNESQFGKHLRGLAIAKLNEILAGVTILYGQDRIGALTVNPNLYKRYGTPEGMYPEHYKKTEPGK